MIKTVLLMFGISMFMMGCSSEDFDEFFGIEDELTEASLYDYTNDDEVIDPAIGGEYNYSYTCPSSGGGTVPIPNGACEDEYEDYAEVFGCNLVSQFDNVSCALENCTGGQAGCGSF